MQGDFVDRDLMIAATALKRQLISDVDLEEAVRRWVEVGSGLLLTYVEELSAFSEMDRQQVRSLFAELNAHHAGRISETLSSEDFERLSAAIASVADKDLQSALDHWKRINASRAAERGTETGRFVIRYVMSEDDATEVLLAHDTELDREVSLRRLRADQVNAAEQSERFRREAAMTGRLQHPGVLPVYSLESGVDNRLSFVTPIVDGEDLAAACAAFHSALGQHPDAFDSSDFRGLLRSFVSICSTLSFAHEQSITHGCPTPNDVLLGNHNATLLRGWGNAVVSDDRDAEFRKRQKRDIEGLGNILHCILTGEVTAPATDSDDQTRIPDTGSAAASADQHGKVSALFAIRDRALKSAQGNGYSSAVQLADDVERWLADKPIEFHLDSTTVRASRWTRRNHRRAALIFCGLLSLIALTFFVSVSWILAEKNHSLDVQQRIRTDESRERQSALRIANARGEYELFHALSQQQLNQGDFHAALNTLGRGSLKLSVVPAFRPESAELGSRTAEVQKLIAFYDAAAMAERAAADGHIELQLTRAEQALRQLQFWGNHDWWEYIPTHLLNAEQTNRLEQAVCRQLQLLADAGAKRLFLPPPAEPGRVDSGSLRDKWLTNDRLAEAEFAMLAADMANRYEFSESMLWIRSHAVRHATPSAEVSVRSLEPPRSAFDAVEIADLLLTRIRDDAFPMLQYEKDVSNLASATKLLESASESLPNDLRTHVLLAECRFLSAAKAVADGAPGADVHFRLVRQTLERCMAIDPDYPGAAAAAASMCLRELSVLRNASDIDDALTKRLTERAVHFATRATETSAPSAEAWWTLGAALYAFGQRADAVKAWKNAVNCEFLFRDLSDASPASANRFRCREQAVTVLGSIPTKKDAAAPPTQDASVAALVAAAHFTIGAYDEARDPATEALESDQPDALAFAVNGMLALKDGQPETAFEHFQKCSDADETSWCAAMGMGRCLELSDRLMDSLSRFRDAESRANTDRQRADALLGQCRVLMLSKRSLDASPVLTAARTVDPTCRLTAIRQLAADLNDKEIQQAIRHFPEQSRTNEVFTAPMVAVRNRRFQLSVDRHWEVLSSQGVKTNQPAPLEDGTSVPSIDYQTLYLESDEASISLEQTVTVEPDVAYEVTVSSAVVSAGQIRIRVYMSPDGSPDGEPLIDHTMDSTGNSEATSTVLDSDSFKAPRQNRFPWLQPVRLRIELSGKGEFRIDDISIHKSLNKPPGADIQM